MIRRDLIDREWKIDEISWFKEAYERPRAAGCNARLGIHGKSGEVPLARIQISGISGFGWGRITRNEARELVGMSVRDMFGEDGLVEDRFRNLEFPMLDWLGNMFEKPVWQLLGEKNSGEENIRIPVYDTSIYFDELGVEDNRKAVSFICEEVRQGMDAGHTNFKVKIGRPGMWMGIEEGLRRDIDIVMAVRDQIGSGAKLMVDANNGYNFNLAKTFLKETKSAGLYWIEEPFHEDDQLLMRMKEWMKENDIQTKIADGEGWASPAIEEWAKKGLIDILQYDLKDYGFCRWMRLNDELERYGVLAAPHNYGSFYGNYVQAHFALAVNNFVMGEWDQAKVESVDTSSYFIQNGFLSMEKNITGFGMELDHERFDRNVSKNGWKIERGVS